MSESNASLLRPVKCGFSLFPFLHHPKICLQNICMFICPSATQLPKRKLFVSIKIMEGHFPPPVYNYGSHKTEKVWRIS
jgi:hypothetical protein